MQIGIWKTDHQNFDENNNFGFVYSVRNNLTNQEYIGRKNFRTKSNKDSGWRNYISSSKYLQEDIKNLGIENFDFNILEIHKTLEDLSNAEYNLHVKLDVLKSKLPCGRKKYYNRNIRGTKFDTTGISRVMSEKERTNISQRQQGEKNSFYGKKHTDEHKKSHSEKLRAYYQNHPGSNRGKIQSVESNRKRSETLKSLPRKSENLVPVNKGKPSPRKGKTRNQPVYVDGCIYPSIRECADIFGLSKNSVKARLNSDKFPGWKYFEE